MASELEYMLCKPVIILIKHPFLQVYMHYQNMYLWKYNSQWVCNLEYSLFYKNKGKKEENDYKQNTCGIENAIFSGSLRAVPCYSVAL